MQQVLRCYSMSGCYKLEAGDGHTLWQHDSC